MPFLKKIAGRHRILVFLFLLFIFFTGLGIFFYANDEAKFERYTETLFLSELSGNTLNLHYTLAYPEKYDLKQKAVLPVYTSNPTANDDKEEILSSIKTLSSISKDKLNPDDAYTYDLLTRYLNLQLKGSSFTYYNEPFSPNSGIQSGLPILLADYTFRRKQDVEDYLDILEQSRAYLEGLLQYETEKAASGLFMSDSSAQKIINQCSVIMDKDALSNGTHFLHITFSERLSSLTKENLITKEEEEAFLSENDRLLTTVMAPAYEQIADTFTLLMGKGQNERGLCYFPQGKAYYEYLFTSVTGSNRSIAEVKRLLFEDFKENYHSLLAVISEYPEVGALSASEDYSLPLSHPDEMLTALKRRAKKEFPAFPEVTSPKDGVFRAKAIIKTVSSSMENYCSPAYYLTPPVDDMTQNIIYINPKNNPDHLNLYTTLAHEGYPGHLYQTVYSQLYMSQNDTSCIRYLLHYGGYVEGWAYYAEDASYEYAKEYVKDNASAMAYYEACRLNRNLHIAMYSLLDIAIHYDGATFSQVQKILASIGISNPETAFNIYEYIREEPCNYLKYYIGFLEMKSLREEAESMWGEHFTPYLFHKFVLETGPSDFTGLKSALQAYSQDSLRPKEVS